MLLHWKGHLCTGVFPLKLLWAALLHVSSQEILMSHKSPLKPLGALVHARAQLWCRAGCRSRDCAQGGSMPTALACRWGSCLHWLHPRSSASPQRSSLRRPPHPLWRRSRPPPGARSARLWGYWLPLHPVMQPLVLMRKRIMHRSSLSVCRGAAQNQQIPDPLKCAQVGAVSTASMLGSTRR